MARLATSLAFCARLFPPSMSSPPPPRLTLLRRGAPPPNRVSSAFSAGLRDASLAHPALAAVLATTFSPARARSRRVYPHAAPPPPVVDFESQFPKLVAAVHSPPPPVTAGAAWPHGPWVDGGAPTAPINSTSHTEPMHPDPEVVDVAEETADRTPKPLSRPARLRALLRDAVTGPPALRPAAAATLISLLHPTDCAALRLLHLKCEARLRSVGGKPKLQQPPAPSSFGKAAPPPHPLAAVATAAMTFPSNSYAGGSEDAPPIPPLGADARARLIRDWLRLAMKAALEERPLPSAPPRPPSSRKRISALKRAVLKDRLDAWLAAAPPEARAAYDAAAADRAAAGAAAAAQADARRAATSTLRSQAMVALKQRAVDVFARRAARAAAAASVAPAGAPKKVVRPPPPIHITKRQLRGEMGRLQSGVLPPPAPPAPPPNWVAAAAAANGDLVAIGAALGALTLSKSTHAGALRAMTRLPPAPASAAAPSVVLSPPVPPAVEAAVEEMTTLAVFFQTRAKVAAADAGKQGPGNKRRIVTGLREVLRGCRSALAPLKLIVFAKNLPPSSTPGGVDSVVAEISAAAAAATPPIPVRFACTRRRLGGAAGLKVDCSVVGFFSFEGLKGLQAQVLAHVAGAAPGGGGRAAAGAVAASTGDGVVKALSAAAPEWTPEVHN